MTFLDLFIVLSLQKLERISHPVYLLGGLGRMLFSTSRPVVRLLELYPGKG